MHALIRNNAIAQVGALPRVWNDGTRDWGLGVDGAVTPEQVTALGWHEVTLMPRPADTATTTYDRAAPALIDGIPTVTWTERPKTVEEIAADQAAANAQTLTADATSDNPKIVQAIEDLRILLGDGATVGSIRAWKQPITNNATLTGAQGKALADLVITQAQADRRIARQVLRLARLVTGDTSSADVGAE